MNAVHNVPLTDLCAIYALGHCAGDVTMSILGTLNLIGHFNELLDLIHEC